MEPTPTASRLERIQAQLRESAVLAAGSYVITYALVRLLLVAGHAKVVRQRQGR